MPDRHKTYRLTLTPATEAALLRLKECGENKQLLSRGHESLKTYLYYTIAWIGYLPLTPWAAWQSMLQDLDQIEAGGGERAGPMLVRFSSVMTATYALCLTLDHIGGGLCGIAGSYALHDYLNNHVAWLERPARHGAVDRRERAHRVDAGRPRHLLYEVGPDGRSAADLLLVPSSGACAWQVGSQTGASRSESERWRLVSRGGRCRSPPAHPSLSVPIRLLTPTLLLGRIRLPSA